MVGAPLIASAPPPATPGGGSLTEFLLYLGLAMAAVIGAGIGIMLFRRRVLGADAGGPEARMLEELRAMRDRGELSPDEFDAARRAALRGPAKAREPGPAQGTDARPAGVPPARRESTSERVARPGFDLTGAPLPPAQDESSGG